MRGKFFNVIFSLVILISFSACNFNTTDYIDTVKKIEVNSPNYNSKDMITVEDLVYGFLKSNYNDITKEDVKWEKLGNLDNGQMLQASYKEAYVKIRAIKNGDFVEITPLELDFKTKDGNRYNIMELPFANTTNEATVSNNVSTNTNYNDSVPSNTSSNENYSSDNNSSVDDPYSEYRNKFGKVVKDKYVGGSLIEFIKNSNDPLEYEYLKEQFWQIADTMYVTQDKKTYYYLNDIIAKLATKADYDQLTKMELNVDGNKLYYFVGFPKEYGANIPSWVEFEIFERKFKDGLALRTAHIRCSINGVRYKDWEAIEAIYK